MPAAIPLGAAAISAIGSIAASRSANNAQARSQNDAWRRQQQYANALTPEALLSRFGADSPIGKWMQSSDPAVQRSETSSTTHTKTNPFITGEYKGLHGLTKGLVESRLKEGGSLPAGYESMGLRAINRAFADPSAATANAGLSRGDFGAGTGAAGQMMDVDRRGKIADFLTSVPMQARANQTEDIGLANQMTEMFGKGMEQTSRTNSFGSSWTEGDLSPGQQFLLNAYLQSRAALAGGPGQAQQPGAGSVIGPLMGGMGNALMMAYGSGAFDKKPTTTSAPWWSPGQEPGGNPFATQPLDFGIFGRRNP